MVSTSTPLVLRITKPTFLKRRVAAADSLGADEKVAKGPCRIPLHSYAYSVPGENLQNHYKVSLSGPYKGSSVWYVYKDHCQIEDANTTQAARPAEKPLVLRITKPTLLKRRPVAAEALDVTDKIAKNPCRIYIHSYAYTVPGEDLKGHVKVCFEGPVLGNSSVWYVYKDHCLIEGIDPPKPAQPASSGSGTGTRQINQAGLDLIKSFEGLRLTAYICPAGVPTIGYGSTAGVKMGDRLTPAQAETLLRRDLVRFEKAVDTLVKVPLTDNQFSALVSFAFNVGIGALQQSTLLKLINQKNYQAAAQELLKWNRGGGRVLPGLTRRRVAEQRLFLQR
ncbi:lysozyme [Oculatella sp. LEGE 06141]|uniref:lysozyme n=1 Tax=Oculatella sp. LEGE 06141 TaxID=1828648 RepID=UPI0018828FC6|nr:lysozyme [Oculatella sp. LEGE 06141]MBE9177552.1 lysozyme [Oculatella sp. LEGE 06141]